MPTSITGENTTFLYSEGIPNVWYSVADKNFLVFPVS